MDKGAPNPWGEVLKDVIAGTCGGIGVTLIGHPFDTLKVRLQTQPIDKPIYSGVVDCARKTVQWEGLGGLYKGVSSPLMGQMFFRATLFGAFGQAKRWLGTNADGTSRSLKPSDFYAAGAITGFVAAFMEGPIDFYKSQIQSLVIKQRQNPEYKPPYTPTVFGAVSASIKHNGIRGPFQGLGATILRNTPANAVYLGNFELFKSAYCNAYSCRPADIPSSVVLCCAGTGGITYWLACFPIDQIKSAMQTDSIINSERKYKTVASTVHQLWNEGGVKRFFRGFAPCLIRAAPANGVMLLTVTRVTDWLNSV